MGSSLLQKAWNIGNPVLAIGVNLEHMSITGLSSVSGTRKHGAALTAISRVSNQNDSGWRAGNQRIEHASASWRAAVIHD
jgi:hypothetical protein